MAEETTPTTPAPAVTGATTPAPAVTEPTEKTFSQEDVNRIVGQRVARSKAEWQAELEAEKKKAQMDEATRAQAEKAELEAKYQKLEAENKRTLRLAELADSGRFQNTKRLAVLLESEGLEGYQHPDGGLDLDKISGAFPEYARPKESTEPRLPGARPANPGLPGTKSAQLADLEAQLKAANEKGQAALGISLERQISELRRK